MGQINTNNYPTVNSLLDADLLIVENAANGTGTTTPKQLRENAIGTGTLQTSAQTVIGAVNELKREIDLGAGVVCYDVNTITSGYLGGQFSGSANLLLLHLTTDGTADATNGYMMLLSYSRPVARFAIGRLVDADGVAYKQDVYADNTIICKISNSGEGTESDPVQVVILGIINAGFMLTPTAVVSDRDIIDGQGNTLSVLAEALTKTASGNPVVITDCAGGKARSLITEINAIQDLHGYDKPWAGGAGKNKFDINKLRANNYIVINVSNDILTLTGEKSRAAANLLGADISYDAESTYTLSFTIDSISGYASQALFFGFIIKKSNNTYRYASAANCNTTGDKSVIVTLATGENIERIDFNVNDNVNDLPEPCTFVLSKVQLEKSSSKTSYAPYSNICPISGRDSVVVTRSDGDEISEDFTIQLGTTVYGAEINWDTGVGTVLWAKIASMTRGSIDSSGKLYTLTFNGVTINPWGSSSSASSYIKCSHFKSMSLDAARTSGDKCIVQYYNGLYIGGYVGAENDLDTLLASGNFDVVCELATPTTIQLTPTMLEMLKGYNRVTIESGSIELGYIAKLT